MSDITSAILYTLVARELARQGLLPSAAPGPVPTSGTVASAEKSSLLDAVHAAHGALPILRIGQGIRDAGPEPTLLALLMARGPHDLLSRWQRLERYVHSHHRVLRRGGGDGELLLEHVSIRDGEVPSAPEDLLILGLLIALFAATGATGLTAHLVEDAAEIPVWSGDDAIDPGPAPRRTGLWRIRWTGPVGDRSGAAGQAGPLPFAVAEDARALVDRIMALILADCSRSWSLQEVARHVGHSTRSLQRRLGEADTTFAAVVRTAQVRKATELLLAGDLSVAEVGLLCGFSDQAHFTREFKRRTNIPPGRYRAEFAS